MIYNQVMTHYFNCSIINQSPALLFIQKVADSNIHEI